MRTTRAGLAVGLFLGASAAWAQAPVSETASVAKALSDLTGLLGTYVAVLAGTSGLAVALLEAFKKLFSIRGRFHRTAVIRWLSQAPTRIPEKLDQAKPGVVSTISFSGSSHYTVPADRMADENYDPATAYAELFHLTSGQKQPKELNPRSTLTQWRGIDRALYELDTAKMMSQVQDAADAVLNTPDKYPQLYAFLTRGAPKGDADDWKAFLATAGATAPTKQQSDLYGRIRLLMRRQLDAFQCVTASRWGDLNQLWAVIVGAVILFVALVMAADTSVADPKQPFMPWKALQEGFTTVWGHGDILAGIALKALLGGALAPIAKDLLTSLSSLKFSR